MANKSKFNGLIPESRSSNPDDFAIKSYKPWELGGWKRNDKEVKKHLSTLAKPTFTLAAPHLKNYYQGESIGLWEACKKVNNGQHLPADKQGIGDCVSHGHARGVDYLYCVKQSAGLASGYQEGYTSAMSEAMYGEMREIGDDLTNEDGAVGIWAIKALERDGYPPRSGKAYDSSLAKYYGRHGTPSELKAAGRIHTLEQYAQLNTPDDMANNLKAGNPCTICTGQGFSMTRDADGVCRPQGQWGHCMAVIGVFILGKTTYSLFKNTRTGRIFVILQSWGQNTPDGPIPYQGPDNSFGCDENTMGQILNEQDSYGLAAIKGFEPLPPLTWKM